ncbi:MAG TPA: SDR family NAD(P)-dependent oxidoreductase [Acidimicrobiales bacterium]|jgi:NAD(P)-dependent dehydrogenase (short-subunit alcohol dehydrogenase family)|nr:SDR family NAD(P)-dependent oxidoreductase [Acidimicrobiales bacterium]
MLQQLTGRVAVVTGAGSGIGAALCRRMGAEGMTVVAADIDGDAARVTAESIGGHPVQVDVSDASSVRALADESFSRFGQVDLLCNNAGVFQSGRAWEPSLDDWNWSLGVNLMGVVHGLSSFLPRMIDQGTDGHVVNTSSVAALVSGPLTAPYIVSKAAVFSLTECLAHDLASIGSGIGASVLVPSAVDTGIARSARVRPARFGVDETETGPMVLGFLAGATHAGMPADDVAGPVLDAVRSGEFLIPTKPSYADQLENRYTRLVERRLPGDVVVD